MKLVVVTGMAGISLIGNDWQQPGCSMLGVIRTWFTDCETFLLLKGGQECIKSLCQFGKLNKPHAT